VAHVSRNSPISPPDLSTIEPLSPGLKHSLCYDIPNPTTLQQLTNFAEGVSHQILVEIVDLYIGRINGHVALFLADRQGHIQL